MANALVAVLADKRGGGTAHRGARPNADFIAHLIATSAQAPQTCARRRAEPAQAVAAYGALDRLPRRSANAVSRSL